MKRGHSLGDITNAIVNDCEVDDDVGGSFTQVKTRRKKSRKGGTNLSISDHRGVGAVVSISYAVIDAAS